MNNETRVTAVVALLALSVVFLVLALFLSSCGGTTRSAQPQHAAQGVDAPQVVYDEEANITFVMSPPLPIQERSEHEVSIALLGAFPGHVPTQEPEQLLIVVNAGPYPFLTENHSLQIHNLNDFSLRWNLSVQQLDNRDFYVGVIPVLFARQLFVAPQVTGVFGGVIQFTLAPAVRPIFEKLIQTLTPTNQ